MLFKVRFIVVGIHQNIEGKIRFEYESSRGGDILEVAKRYIIAHLLPSNEPGDIIITHFKQIVK